MDDLEELIKVKNWQRLVRKYSPQYLSKSLPFRESLVLSRKILENEAWDGNLQNFAVKLIEETKRSHPIEWESNWKHEAYLGYAYGILVYEPEKEFDAYQKAAKSANPPPPEVMMELTANWSYPGIYQKKMTKEKAIEILENVAGEIPYIEAVTRLAGLYEETQQEKKAVYWKKVLKESQKKKLYDRRPYLDFFNEYGW
ncbi:MAG: hypothetical protein WB791_06595 [Waddliaceae bacterium]